VTIPPLPAPLPILPLPTSASVSGGTGGAPIGRQRQRSGLDRHRRSASGIADSAGTSNRTDGPGDLADREPPAYSGTRSASRVSRVRLGAGSQWSLESVGRDPGDRAASVAVSPLTAGAAQPVAPAGPQLANVGASINAQPADSLLQRIPTIASRVALWLALAGVVFVLQMLIGSAVRQHRRKSVPIS